MAGRQIKEVNSAEDGLDDVRPIQPLTTSLAEMHVTSLASLASIDESVFVNEECRVSGGNVNCVLKPVFNNCTVNFNFKKSINFVRISEQWIMYYKLNDNDNVFEARAFQKNYL